MGQGMLTPTGSQIEYTMNGNEVFGGLSSQVVGYRTLTPGLTGGTKLSDLSGAALKGVTAGIVNVTVGATTTAVDLSSAKTVNDVVSMLNAGLAAAGTTATVAMSGGSLVVTG